MKFPLKLTTRAIKDMEALARDAGQQKRFKSVQKVFGLLETNPRHRSLRTHKFQSLQGPNNEPVFEAYAENKTPAAYRIFFYYGPSGEIVIIAVTPHP